MGQELTGNVCYFFVLHMILDGVIEEVWICFTKFHIVDTDAVVGESFTVDVSNSPTNLQKLLIGSYGFFELA